MENVFMVSPTIRHINDDNKFEKEGGGGNRKHFYFPKIYYCQINRRGDYIWQQLMDLA